MAFEQRDAIAVHTVTAAAHGLLRDLMKARGKGSFIKDNPILRPERRKEFIDRVNGAQNFFKHADQDPVAEIEFRLALTRFLLLDAVLMCQELTGHVLREGAVFTVWFWIEYPDLLELEDQPALAGMLMKARQLGSHPVTPEMFRILLELAAVIPNLE